jgi:hypothetical protein
VNPQAFLNLLMYEIREYVEGFWEGLKTKVLVPCPQPCGVRGALRGRFDLDQIYARLHRGKDTAECRSDCAQDVPVSQLLECLGDGGPTLADKQAAIIREAVSGALADRIEPLLRRQDELALSGQRMIMARIGELGDDLREQFSSVEERLAVLMRALDDEAADGPRLFTLEPVDRTVWRPGLKARRMRLTLWCEHSKVPVRLLNPGKPDAGVYTVDIPRDWWVKAAPLIRTTSMLLKALLPVSLPAVQADVDDNQWKAISERLTLGKESLGAVAELGKNIQDPDDPGLDLDTDQPTLAEGGLLRMLHALLRDQDVTLADLRRVRNHQHRIIWVHPLFEPIYNPALPHIPR